MMANKARILILIGAHLWTSPRSQKEAQALASAGHDVTISGIWFDELGASRDRALAAGKPWKFEPALDIREPTALGRVRNVAVRGRRRMDRELCSRLGWRLPAALGYGAQGLLRAALEYSADLTIVHSEANLWVGSELLDRGRRVGVDFEDWFSEDLREDQRQAHAMQWLQEIEQQLLRRCTYSITTSKAMSIALSEHYGAPPPAVVYNVFPFAERSALDGVFKDRKDPNVPSVHWFSQTIGPGRGLEMFFAATRDLATPFEIHLRGRMAMNYEGDFRRLVPDHVRERLFIHDTVPNDALLSRIAEHDIGLALERSERASRQLSITNKLFQYMQGGLAMIATDTKGQAEVFAAEPEIGLMIPNNDVNALVEALRVFLDDKGRLRKARAASIEAARRTFCWEKQADTIVQSAERALAGNLHVG
jgi:glycosyltransferase involved in cell wall biosynthesis